MYEALLEKVTARAQQKLREQNYSEPESAATDAAQEVLCEEGYDSRDLWPETLYNLLRELAAANLQSSAWNGYVFEHEGDLYLDGDPCPQCGSEVLNVTITECAQFVGASGRRKRRVENAAQYSELQHDLYQADDGPWFEELTFVRCGMCEAVLHEG